MSIKLFISYSHKDKKYLEIFETHLAVLKREDLVESWFDQKILPGNKWNKSIENNLLSSQLIVFLISPDFLDSQYCLDIELDIAKNQVKSGNSILIPIIIRPCSWTNLNISEFQVLPDNAKPVSKWNDPDDAWLNIITKIQITIKELEKNRLIDLKESQSSLYIKKEFIEFLEDTQATFTHRYKQNITLSDIFVYPDLKVLGYDFDKISNTVQSENLFSKTKNKLIFIFGDEQSGKTGLCKKLCMDFHTKGFSPIFLKGKKINTSNINKLTQKAIIEQYISEKDINRDKQVIIIDNYHKIRLNQKAQKKFINNLKSIFQIIIIVSDDSFKYILHEVDFFHSFVFYELLPFGHLKRTKLIEKWISLGREEVINDNELYDQLDNIKIHVDSFVRKNIVPSKPIYILIIMQHIESIIPNKIELTSYGHCYQYLIYQSLEKASIQNSEIDKYLNYLTEFAFYIFNNNLDSMSTKNLNKFSGYYSKDYLSINQTEMIERLLLCGILEVKNSNYSFKQKYIYYFYVAKYIAENLSDNDKIKQTLLHLLNNLHVEEYANIIIFVTHHTKDKYILEEIQLSMMDLFPDQKEATLEKDELSFLQDFIDQIPKIVLKNIDVENERMNHEIKKDIEEIHNGEEDDNFDMDPYSIVSILNKSNKSIEIIGQIIRNRYGSLKKPTLYDLADSAYGVGLRSLTYFLNISEKVQDEIVNIIKMLLSDSSKINSYSIEKEAKKIFILIIYGVTYGLLRKISFSVGSKEAAEVYELIKKKNDSPAIRLINTSINLNFSKKFDINELKKTFNSLKGNINCQRLFKEIIVQHMYMHHFSYQEKQQISEIFKIPMMYQRTIEHKEDTKMFEKQKKKI